ncbi:MAG: Hint domain-containing protein [Paracoccaceae bacterium]
MQRSTFQVLEFSTFAHDPGFGVFLNGAGCDGDFTGHALVLDHPAGDHASAQLVSADGSVLAQGAFQALGYLELEDTVTQIRHWAIQISVDGVACGVITRHRPRADSMFKVRARDIWLTPPKTASRSGAWMGPGTIVMTQDGAMPVEWIEAGQQIATKDRGFQPVQHVLRSPLRPLNELNKWVALRGGSNAEAQEAALVVSPDTDVLAQSAQAELLFASHEVLLKAADSQHKSEPALEDGKDATALVMHNSELIEANGIWIGTWCHHPVAMAQLSAVAKVQIVHKLGVAHRYQTAARPCLSPIEAHLAGVRLPELAIRSENLRCA